MTPKTRKWPVLGPRWPYMAKWRSIMELGASTSYHSKSQPKRSHDDPKTIQFHVFQPKFRHFFKHFWTLSEIFQNGSQNRSPTISGAVARSEKSSGIQGSKNQTEPRWTYFGLPTSSFFFAILTSFVPPAAKGRPPAGQKIQKYMHLFGKGLFLASVVPSALT